MVKIGVCLCVTDSVAAAAMYCRAFRLELGYHVLNDDGSYYHSELWREDCEVLDVVEAATSGIYENTAQPATKVQSANQQSANQQQAEPNKAESHKAEPNKAEPHNPVQLAFTFDSKEELLQAYDILREGGSVQMEPCELPWSPWAAQVTDRYNVNWYLTVPQHYPPESFAPADLK